MGDNTAPDTKKYCPNGEISSSLVTLPKVRLLQFRKSAEVTKPRRRNGSSESPAF
jgi:hypothetical protein